MAPETSGGFKVIDPQDAVICWLLASDEPWTRYRTRLDLLGEPEDAPEVQAERAAMLAHPQVQALIAGASRWGEAAIKRHNDAASPIYLLTTLVEFGLRAADPGLGLVAEKLLAHPSPDGAFQSVVNIAPAFGGSGLDTWSWMACDAPTLLYVLLELGVGDDERLQRAASHLASLVEDNGCRCRAAPDLGKFRGPGAKADPCPMATLLALKALACFPDQLNGLPALRAAEMLLQHFSSPPGTKYYLFGAGSDFRKLKYPFVWYDILHAAYILSRIPAVIPDPRFRAMLETILSQADSAGRYTPSSMYQARKGWSFADKKSPSPWLTFLVLRLQKNASWKEPT